MATVLVVDDSEADRESAGQLLQHSSDLTVTYAADGAEALDQLRNTTPDLIVTDLHMPDMNGMQLLSSVRADYPGIPVILVTGHGSEAVAVEALQNGAASYVAKSRLSRDFLRTVLRVLAVAAEERDVSRLMEHVHRNEIDFALENDPTLFPTVIRYVQGVAAALQTFDSTDRVRLGVAIDEALLNAHYHGNLEVSSELRDRDDHSYFDLARRRTSQHPYCNRRIKVNARFTRSELAIVVKDAGSGFDPSQLPDVTDEEHLAQSHGRGILLMRTIMDEVTYNDVGNQVTLVKRTPEAVDALSQ